jgi:hypothetical protein
LVFGETSSETFISDFGHLQTDRFCQIELLVQESCNSWVVGACAPPKLQNEICERSAPGGCPCAPMGCGLVVTSVIGILPPQGGAPAHRRPGDANCSATILRAFRPPGGAVSPLAPLSTLRSRLSFLRHLDSTCFQASWSNPRRGETHAHAFGGFAQRRDSNQRRWRL